MARDLKAKVRLTADTKQADAALKKTQKGILSLGTSIIGGAAAFGAFTKAVTFAVKASIEQQRVVAQLDNQLKSLGESAESVSQALQAQASALQRVSTFGDEEIIKSQAIIAAFTKEESQIKALTKVTIDFAIAKGVDLNTAADLVAKSFGSSTNALSRYGVQVEGAAGSTERLLDLTTGLAELFGGAALAEAKTFGGQLDRLSGALTDTSEEFGKAATESRDLGRALEFSINAVQDFNDEVSKSPQKASLFGLAVDSLFNPIQSFFRSLIQGRVDALIPWGAAAEDAAEAADELDAAVKRLSPTFESTQKAIEATKDALREIGVVLDEDVNKAVEKQEDLLDALHLAYNEGAFSRADFERSEAAIADKIRELNGELAVHNDALELVDGSTLSYAEALRIARADLDRLTASEVQNTLTVEDSSRRRLAARQRESRFAQNLLGGESTFATVGGGTFFIPDQVQSDQNGRVSIAFGSVT